MLSYMITFIWKKVRDIFTVEFYKKKNGEVPVLNFLYSLDSKMRAKAFRDIELLKNLGNKLREPYIKPIKGKIITDFMNWE